MLENEPKIINNEGDFRGGNNGDGNYGGDINNDGGGIYGGGGISGKKEQDNKKDKEEKNYNYKKCLPLLLIIILICVLYILVGVIFWKINKNKKDYEKRVDKIEIYINQNISEIEEKIYKKCSCTNNL